MCLFGCICLICGTRLVEICQQLRACYLKSNVPSQLLLGFHCLDFPGYSHLKIQKHALQTMQIWLQSVVIKGNLHEKKCAYSAVSSNVIITTFPISYSVSCVLGKKDRFLRYLIQTFPFVTKTVVHDIIRKDKECKLVHRHGMNTNGEVEIQLILSRFRKIAKSNY